MITIIPNIRIKSIRGRYSFKEKDGEKGFHFFLPFLLIIRTAIAPPIIRTMNTVTTLPRGDNTKSVIPVTAPVKKSVEDVVKGIVSSTEQPLDIIGLLSDVPQ